MQWPTHEISNQVPDLQDYNIFGTDPILQAGIAHHGATAYQDKLTRLGHELGSAETLELGALANLHPPSLATHDKRGYRIDQVEFHPSWHRLMDGIWHEGLHNLPWARPQEGAHVARAAAYYMQGQVEAGSLCPTTMTFACIPVLQQESELFADLRDKLYSTRYDPRDIPLAGKHSIVVGMGMTEKQGGSDVRSNTTRAVAIGESGRGQAYALTGHKWFFSAPMCDAHLVLARSEAGLSCFFVPRWKPDGSKNPILIQRLKDKLGNRSNSSSEVEFQQAYGVMVGEEGRGIPTIIEMANHTRLDCVIGSAALMRQALVQGLHHARHRQAFGKTLIDQALMRNVLCDLALESEAATLLMLRLAQSVAQQTQALERAWRRILTPASKFWVCKRALEFSGEAMEVWGGNGYVETGPMARLYREAPVNSIWEGSGNVMCLDVLRAIQREPEAFQTFLAWLAHMQGRIAQYDQALLELRSLLESTPDMLELQARRLAQLLVLCAQSALMLEQVPEAVAIAFIRSRFDASCGRVFGCLTADAPMDEILARSWKQA